MITVRTVRSLALQILGSVFALGVAAQTTATVVPEEHAPHDAHPPQVDTANIRLHRLKHLDARLNSDPLTLQANCRYESEISTVPPQKHIALTFDDGPEPVQTEYILEVLKRYDISATFFLIGAQVQRHPDLVQKILAAGHHQIASHSWDHPNFHSIPVAEQAQEVTLTEAALGPNMKAKYFRYPYGNASCETNRLLRSSGYKIVGWHIDSCDWAFDKTGSVDAKEAATCGVLPPFHNDFTEHVLSALRVHGGGIVLMHEIHPNTLKHLETIVRSALAEGYVFDTVDSLLFAASMR